MVNIVLVQFLSLLLFAAVPAKDDRIYMEVSLGEKPLENYAGRYDAFVSQDIFSGRLSFSDDEQLQSFFNPYMFSDEKDYSTFFRSEISSALICTNDQFSRHYDDLRFSYRLITLSYLLEGQWHMKLTSDKLRLKNGCQFEAKKWLEKCEPRSEEMKKLVDRLKKYEPKYDESLPVNYNLDAWNREIKAGHPIWYSQTRLNKPCKGGCPQQAMETLFNKACSEDENLMTLICSEKDDLYGLSSQKDAYFLIAKSNIINTFNKEGEALGCLRRFSEVMGHRESHYPVLKTLFPSLESFLIEKYQERFMQGRIFFFGAAKEFEEKGLTEVFTTKKKEDVKPAVVLAEPKKPEEKKPEPVKTVAAVEPPRIVMETPPPKKEVDTMKMKSAFLQAAEIRAAQNLNHSEVDMTKLRYDYVFSLNMINTLSTKLKTFMTREALSEMLAYDQLGTKQGPVPLLFIKFLMDFHEHQGLWNLISVVGDKFYVSNDIDTKFKPQPELVQLKNDESTGRQWQLFILKP